MKHQQHSDNFHATKNRLARNIDSEQRDVTARGLLSLFFTTLPSSGCAIDECVYLLPLLLFFKKRIWSAHLVIAHLSLQADQILA